MGTTVNITELNKKVCEHEAWIVGTTKEKGANARIGDLEIQFGKIEAKLNWILGIMGTIMVGLLLWALTGG